MKTIYNTRISELVKTYDLARYYQHKFKSYFFLRRNTSILLRDLFFRNAGRVIFVLYDGEMTNKQKTPFSLVKSLFIVDISNCWKKSSAYIKDYIGKEILKTEKRLSSNILVICISNNRLSNYIDEAVLPLSVEMGFEYINIYDYLNHKGCSLLRTDLFLKKIRNKSDLIYNLTQFVCYYGYFFPRVARKLTNVNRYFPFYGSRDDIYCEHHNIQRRWALKKYVQEDYAFKSLVAAYVKVRDFRSLFELAEQVKNDPQKQWIQNLRKDIEGILDDIKRTNDSRKGRVIIVNWLDGVSFLKMRDMEWVSSLKDDSVFFTNMYNVMPTTSIGFKSMLSGKMPMKGRLFDMGFIGKGGEYPIFDSIENEGYIIKYVGGAEKGANHFQPYVFRNTGECLYNSPCTDRQWEAVTMLAENPDTDYFVFVHNFHESHSPHAFIQYDGMLEMWHPYFPESQKVACRKYVDEEVRWYEKYYGNAVEVYMSDHGDGNDEEPYYSEELTHLIFMVRNGQRRVVDDMISLKDMCKTIMALSRKEDISCYLNDHINVEAYDAYSKTRVDTVIRENIPKQDWMQYQVYRTKEELYVLFADGEERYYRLPDETTDLSNMDEYREIIKEYRKQLIPNFLDVYNEPYFRETKRLYELNKVKMARE